jgi:Tol biopolymer transport system component
VWSPDGKKIAFCIDPDGGNWDKSDIYIMDADGSNVQQLTNTPASEWGLDWTAYSYGVEPAGKLKSTWGKIKSKLFKKD